MRQHFKDKVLACKSSLASITKFMSVVSLHCQRFCVRKMDLSARHFLLVSFYGINKNKQSLRSIPPRSKHYMTRSIYVMIN